MTVNPRLHKLFQRDTIHSDDCKSKLQHEDSAPAPLILTTKLHFQLDSNPKINKNKNAFPIRHHS